MCVYSYDSLYESVVVDDVSFINSTFKTLVHLKVCGVSGLLLDKQVRVNIRKDIKL